MSKPWLLDRWFCALVATIDMFLAKFPDHKFAEARISTISARFKDCAGLLDAHYLSDTLDLEFDELCTWIWHGKTANEFVRVVKTGEEVELDKLDDDEEEANEELE